MTRLFLSAGDTSGDQHAARLVTALRERLGDPGAPGLLEIEGFGGPELAAAGVTLHEDLVDANIMGIGPALAALPHYFGLLRRVAGVLDARRPDAVVLVDFPGFNLFVARLARRRGLPVIYFVTPQLWAWAPWRVARFARAVDEALVILPFEAAWFTARGLPATFVGHPLLDRLADADTADAELAGRPCPVALLPGSRPREVREHMPALLEVAARVVERHPEASFHSAHVEARAREAMAAAARSAGVELTVHGDRVHAVMAGCRAAAVASGTATLETALLGTPLVAFYQVSRFEDVVGNALLVTPHKCLVNLVAGGRVVPEVYRRTDLAAGLAAALLPLLDEGPARAAQLDALATVHRRMGGPGAIERAADRIADRLGLPARA